MSPIVGLIAALGLVTGALLVLYICRSRLESKETDWIPLTDDAREDQAIHEQEAIEKKAHRFDKPIRALGAISVALLLVLVGVWLYQGIMTPPAAP